MYHRNISIEVNTSIGCIMYRTNIYFCGELKYHWTDSYAEWPWLSVDPMVYSPLLESSF